VLVCILAFFQKIHQDSDLSGIRFLVTAYFEFFNCVVGIHTKIDRFQIQGSKVKPMDTGHNFVRLLDGYKAFFMHSAIIHCALALCIIDNIPGRQPIEKTV